MALCREGLSALDPDPPASSCAGCSSAEAKIQALLDHIARSFVRDPARFLGFELPARSEAGDICWEMYSRWVERFKWEADYGSRFPMCPDLKRRIEALVYRLLSERYGVKRVREEEGVVVSALASLRCAAASPLEWAVDGCEGFDWIEVMLRARVVMSRMNADDSSGAREFPRLKRRRSRKFLLATNNNTPSQYLLNEPIRRSKRTLLKISTGELSRKRIPVGPFFQADVPDWTGPPEEELLDNTGGLNKSKWLGSTIWPIEGDNRQLSDVIIGKGKPDFCDCNTRGSAECIRFHVNTARLHLKSCLGPAFFNLGFAEMGEDVSKSWTQEEQMVFDDIVRMNPFSEGKSFWEPAVNYFTSKSRKDIVSFYFNVFLLRWMSIRTRLGAWTVDSSDDEYLG